ncbi:alpha-tocopherol transfer protein-like [Neocloeon triangulifer]|uniref:alpha-tocopherol transfer protein-like n=1 Tax=Neocloeon triangulifer TaxID=2078957 RepID=UPI00286F42AC|nr:alpha-tocopherol transfer protein-like [Neocloeon triangulifer]
MDPKHTLELGPAAPELQLRAALEIRESDQVREAALAELRALIEQDGSLDCRTDDEYLIRFLRPTKFYPESALKMIKDYFGHITKHADVYSKIGPSQQAKIFDNDLVSVSPVRDQFGRRVTIMKFGAWSSKMGTMDDLYGATVQCAELGASEPATQMMGGVAVLDMKGTSLRHVANLSPSYAKKTVDLLQGNFPMRFKAFHIINQPRLFDLVFAIFKPFLSSKLKSRIHFHGNDMKSLQNHVSPACLTKEYKGQLTHFDQEGLIDLLHDNEHIYKGIRQYAFEQQS